MAPCGAYSGNLLYSERTIMNVDYNRLAQEYALHRHIVPEVLEHLIQTGGLGPASRVLEVGCGTGNYSAALERTVRCACWGLDPSERMLAAAARNDANIHLQQGKAEELVYTDCGFDLVFSVDVIHHVVDRAAYFREAYRVLRLGGRVCTATDSEDILRSRQPMSVYFPETIELELKRYPRIADLRSAMDAAGFNSVEEARVAAEHSLTDIQMYRDKAFSCLHLIPADTFERGIRRMEADARSSPIPSLIQYVLLWGVK